LGRAILAGVLMMPIELAHHLVTGPAGLFLIAGYSALIVIGMVLRMGNKDITNPKN
jgi:hypothetical protein